MFFTESLLYFMLLFCFVLFQGKSFYILGVFFKEGPLYISPDVILCGWLGLKHQLTN